MLFAGYGQSMEGWSEEKGVYLQASYHSEFIHSVWGSNYHDLLIMVSGYIMNVLLEFLND